MGVGSDRRSAPTVGLSSRRRLRLQRAEVMDKEDILERLENLNVWRRGDQRAPHKPLLVLLGLAKIARGEERLNPFEEFGPP